MQTLSATERRALRAKAHHLRPVVSIGQHGLTPAVVHEIDVNLTAHELLKIRVFSEDRAERDALLARICSELDAAPVQHLGKLLIVWRPAPEPPAADPPRAARRSDVGPAAGAAQGKKTRAGARKEHLPEIPASRRRKPAPHSAAPATRKTPDKRPPRGLAAGKQRGAASATITTGPQAQGPRTRRRRTPR